MPEGPSLVGTATGAATPAGYVKPHSGVTGLYVGTWPKSEGPGEGVFLGVPVSVATGVMSFLVADEPGGRVLL